MCKIFVSADPSSCEGRTRSVRLHGVVTSLRLENLHWTVLEEIAGRDSMTVAQLIEKLCDELVADRVLDGLQRVPRTAVPVIEARQPGPALN